MESKIEFKTFGEMPHELASILINAIKDDRISSSSNIEITLKYKAAKREPDKEIEINFSVEKIKFRTEYK